jgi:hypothetical protein
MKREDVYATWVGQDHPWVSWVKRALFASVADDASDRADESQPQYRSEAPPWAGTDVSWLPDRAAVIVDLPGHEAVAMGLALGTRGLRPVLSINACSESGELIPMDPVVDLLRAGARFTKSFPMGPSVLPCFILDSRRNSPRAIRPGDFDNRWAVFASDLPSSDALRDVGASRIVVVQKGVELLGDLKAVLRRYSAAGLELSLHDVTASSSLTEIHITPSGWFARFVEQVERRLAWSRNWDGSFGRRVPIPPSPSHG